MAKHFYLSEDEKKFFRERVRRPLHALRAGGDDADLERGAPRPARHQQRPLPRQPAQLRRHLDIPNLNQIISNPRLVDKISSILGPDVLSWRTEWFPKYPGDEGTDWHQAESFVEFEGTEKLEPTAAVEGQPWELTAWIAMTRRTRPTAA